MAKGENIFRRKDGRWEARYVKGRELSGKIKYGFCYGRTYREAKEKVTKIKAELLGGKLPTVCTSKHRFSFYCDEWLRFKRDGVRESTYIKYEAILRKHIKPKLGACFPTGISDAVAEAFVHQLLSEDKLSAKTVQDILSVLRSVMKYASKHSAAPLVQIDISYPKEAKKEARVLSHNEQECFAKYLLEDMDSCKFGVLLMLLTGIRIGELSALKWKDINIAEKTIRISATLQRLRDTDPDGVSRTKILIGTPKSGTSVRTIPMTDYTAGLCEKMSCGDEAYVLTGAADYMEPRALQYRIGKYTKDCGLEGVHAHTLRHTFATRAVEVGFEIKSLSEVLGHANTTITLERYVHSSMELKRANMNKLASAGF